MGSKKENNTIETKPIRWMHVTPSWLPWLEFGNLSCHSLLFPHKQSAFLQLIKKEPWVAMRMRSSVLIRDSKQSCLSSAWHLNTVVQRGCSIWEELVALRLISLWPDVASFSKEHRKTFLLLTQESETAFHSSFSWLVKAIVCQGKLQISLFAVIDLYTVIFRVW